MGVRAHPPDSMGDGFIKVDFHIHTPESKCYNDSLAGPEQLVDTAIAAGLEAIAVTDHNTFGGVDYFREIGREKGLAVFPGVELSARGGHVLALFDRETAVSDLEGLLAYVGVSPAGKGDGSAPIGDWIEDVFRKVDEWAGIAIAAHIERWPTGFLQTNERRRAKMRIHNNQYLSALEITQPNNRLIWNRGEMRNYPKKYACIQGSDAHSLDEIGRRATFMNLPTLDLEGLRAAFREYDSRIRFPDDMYEQV